jgi:hypothetical protein
LSRDKNTSDSCEGKELFRVCIFSKLGRKDSRILGTDIVSDQDKREIILEFISRMVFLIVFIPCPIGLVAILKLFRIEFGREAKLELIDFIEIVRGSSKTLVTISDIDSGDLSLLNDFEIRILEIRKRNTK